MERLLATLDVTATTTTEFLKNEDGYIVRHWIDEYDWPGTKVARVVQIELSKHALADLASAALSDLQVTKD